MKTRRVQVSECDINELEGLELYLVEGPGETPERLLPTHMHIFPNGHLLVCTCQSMAIATAVAASFTPT